jgi:hypothetical protein
MSKRLLSGIAVLAALTAVVPPARAQQEQRTADWYLANLDAARQEEYWCNEHPAEEQYKTAHGDLNCINARQALASLLLHQQGEDEDK